MASNLTKFFLSGFPTDGLAPAVWQGGETEALARLDKHLERKVTHYLSGDSCRLCLPMKNVECCPLPHSLLFLAVVIALISGMECVLLLEYSCDLGFCVEQGAQGLPQLQKI